MAACALAVFFAVVSTGAYWLGKPVPVVPISHSIGALPLYAFYSIVRIGIAYLLSLTFAVAYGYIAAYNPRIEAVDDRGPRHSAVDSRCSAFCRPSCWPWSRSFPAIKWASRWASILLIFTGQVWNLAFSFYSSLKSIPREMLEASRIYRYSAWQRFWQLEMPYAAIGLVWNSIVSVAGGWFALMACEMFTMGDRNFQLPGLGSYLQTAADSGDVRALVAGFAVVILIVVATDQLVWRPLIAWSDKFKFEQVESADRVTSPILESAAALDASSAPCPAASWHRIEEPIYRRIAQHQATAASCSRSTTTPSRRALAGCSGHLAVAGADRRRLGSAAGRPHAQHRHLARPAAAARGRRRHVSPRQCALLISAAWTIPVGVAIGFNPRLARFVQPVAQILASVPATAFFPILLIGLVKIGGGLGIGSIALMLLGTQWYILFNVIAGAMSIPSDLREVASLYRFTRWQRWTRLILPGIFPYLITGMVTASGGAWNASVFAEYSHMPGPHAADHRPGRADHAATDSGRFPILLLATILISLMVVTMNRLVWRRLYRLAETRYKLEG